MQKRNDSLSSRLSVPLSRVARITVATLLAAATLGPARADAEHSLDEYRHFRTTTIDLLGRMPTLEEVEAFEKPGFSLDAFVDQHLGTVEYADRLLRVYMDLLRLEPGPNVNFGDSSVLYRKTLVGPEGKDIYVYYRKGQRRLRDETDGDFCLAASDVTPEAGPEAKQKQERDKKERERKEALENAKHPKKGAVKEKPGAPGKVEPAKPPDAAPMAMGPAKKHVSQKALDANTIEVKPWWLYRDYAKTNPEERYNEGWKNPDPAYQPAESLLLEADKTPTEQIRICKEEAQTAEEGHLHAAGVRPKPKPGEPPPFGRTTQLPQDSGYATAHRGESVRCANRLAQSSAVDCGCGVGLERCIPSDNEMQGGTAFQTPLHDPIGIDGPLDSQKQQAGRWYAVWWAQEAQHFLRRIFSEDRDFREILTSHATYVNGPLTQFYRSIEPASCCGQETNFGMTAELEPLFNPQNLPSDLQPQDVSKWELVQDRGPHAAGILTMPIFLEKFASRRARAASLYQAFLCKSFSADTVELTPSTEPNLMVRPGCSTCHATLEPLAAYFSRVEETSWVFLPPQQFPLQNPTCKLNDKGKPVNGACNTFYDPDFSNNKMGMLRGAYASPSHANEAPEGAGRDLVASPDFARCAAQRVTASFLGRPLGADDQALLTDATNEFVKDNYKMRALVKAVIKSAAYARSNNLSSETWRGAAK